MKTQPARLCPRFSHCSVNSCPLDPSYLAIPIHPDDKEQTCTIEKNVRLRIASQFPGVLKLNGMTPREHAARKRYEALSPAVKSQMAEAGRSRLASFRNSQQPQNG